MNNQQKVLDFHRLYAILLYTYRVSRIHYDVLRNIVLSSQRPVCDEVINHTGRS